MMIHSHTSQPHKIDKSSRHFNNKISICFHFGKFFGLKFLKLTELFVVKTSTFRTFLSNVWKQQYTWNRTQKHTLKLFINSTGIVRTIQSNNISTVCIYSSIIFGNTHSGPIIWPFVIFKFRKRTLRLSWVEWVGDSRSIFEVQWLGRERIK